MTGREQGRPTPDLGQTAIAAVVSSSSASHPLTLDDGRRLYLVTFERHDRTQHALAYGRARQQAIRSAEDQWGGAASAARLVR